MKEKDLATRIMGGMVFNIMKRSYSVDVFPVFEKLNLKNESQQVQSQTMGKLASDPTKK